MAESGLLPPHGVEYRLKFWEVGVNVVFTKVKFPGDHAESGRQFRGCGGIVPSAGTGNDTGYCRMGGRNCEASVTVDGAFKFY